MDRKMIDIDLEWNEPNIIEILAEERQEQIFEPNYFITNDINFAENVWDFTRFMKNYNNPSDYKFNFSQIHSTTFRIILKKTVLRNVFFKERISNKSKIHSVKKAIFGPVLTLIKYLENEKFIYEPELITAFIIKQYIKKKFNNVTERYLQLIISGLKKIIHEMEFLGIDLDYSSFESIWTSINRKKINNEVETNKTPNIPQNLYSKIKKCALEDIDNEALNYSQRTTACIIIILANTGMRIGECELLEADRLKKFSIFNDSKNAYYIEFITYKTTFDIDGKWTETIASPEAVKAYKKWVEISQKRRKRFNTNYLHTNEYTGKRYTQNMIRRNIKIFFLRHQAVLNFDSLSEIEKSQIHVTTPRTFVNKYKTQLYIDYKELDKEFYYINPHQFRVALVNQLKNRGVQLQWLRRHMNHLEEEMTKHYFRDDEDIIEALFYRASSDGSMLESNPNKVKHNIKCDFSDEELVKAYNIINNFLSKKKLNIFKDIDQIIDTMKNNPLRETYVGLCTKAIGTICERQERLATIEKWYFIRPHIADISSFDFTYKRFCEKAKVVEHNKKLFEINPKFERQYSIEYQALKKFYINCFSVEFSMLYDKVKNGEERKVLTSYPWLKDVITRINEIELEVALWVEKLTLEI
ncbi:site-specific integrase [Bacillus luteolus]|uniref:Site-specific integrase n=1 Tax=Litchfieldia luteola TaxID=682179 RepID=A0ABR9QP16_9BACI|nr:tyrosine-type recombinase/integrase [Cytobacillus luteolus]MBE4910194.1 site-specific integrase [Cytobacillus luteolus]MBP1942237.1 integrase [Cytobacillus luteolus]